MIGSKIEPPPAARPASSSVWILKPRLPGRLWWGRLLPGTVVVRRLEDRVEERPIVRRMLSAVAGVVALAIACPAPVPPPDLTGVITQASGAVRVSGPGVGPIPLESLSGNFLYS